MRCHLTWVLSELELPRRHVGAVGSLNGDEVHGTQSDCHRCAENLECWAIPAERRHRDRQITLSLFRRPESSPALGSVIAIDAMVMPNVVSPMMMAADGGAPNIAMAPIATNAKTVESMSLRLRFTLLASRRAAGAQGALKATLCAAEVGQVSLIDCAAPAFDLLLVCFLTVKGDDHGFWGPHCAEGIGGHVIADFTGDAALFPEGRFDLLQVGQYIFGGAAFDDFVDVDVLTGGRAEIFDAGQEAILLFLSWVR